MASPGSRSTRSTRSLSPHPSTRPDRPPSPHPSTHPKRCMTSPGSHGTRPKRRLSSHTSTRSKRKKAPVLRTGTTPARIILRCDHHCRLLSTPLTDAVDARFYSIPVHHHRGMARTHSCHNHNETILRLHTCETAIFVVGVISPAIFGIGYYAFFLLPLLSTSHCIFHPDLVPCQVRRYTVVQLSHVVLCALGHCHEYLLSVLRAFAWNALHCKPIKGRFKATPHFTLIM